MIGLRDVSHSLNGMRSGPEALRRVTFVFPPECVALLCPDPAARRIILDLLTATIAPESGKINWKGRVSWSIGRTHPFRSQLDGVETVDFFSDVYNLDPGKVIRFIGKFPPLGANLSQRTSSWSLAASIKFSMILALTADFDIYICDGPLALPGETPFNDLWQACFKERLVGRTAVISSMLTQTLFAYCSRAVVAEDGGLRLIDNLARGLAAYPQRPDVQDNSRSLAAIEQDDSAE
jgi:capsular polysaccharide transport system ATP-binding protein